MIIFILTSFYLYFIIQRNSCSFENVDFKMYKSRFTWVQVCTGEAIDAEITSTGITLSSSGINIFST